MRETGSSLYCSMVSLCFKMAIQNTMCWCPKNQLDLFIDTIYDLFYQLDFIDFIW